jgi:hypothetical protein
MVTHLQTGVFGRRTPKTKCGPAPLLTPLVFIAAAVKPTGLPNFGDNLAVCLPPFNDLNAMVDPPIPVSNIWDLNSMQGAHLGLRRKATTDRRLSKLWGDHKLRTSLQGGVFLPDFV